MRKSHKVLLSEEERKRRRSESNKKYRKTHKKVCTGAVNKYKRSEKAKSADWYIRKSLSKLGIKISDSKLIGMKKKHLMAKRKYNESKHTLLPCDRLAARSAISRLNARIYSYASKLERNKDIT